MKSVSVFPAVVSIILPALENPKLPDTACCIVVLEEVGKSVSDNSLS